MDVFRFIDGLIKNSVHLILNTINRTHSQNSIFRNVHEGKRCFILGSGHSILSQDLTLLENEIVFTQNHFHAHKDIQRISPKYHVVVPKYQPKEFDGDWKNWLNSMVERLPSDTTLFFGSNLKYLIDQYAELSRRAYYTSHKLKPLYLSKARIDITKNVMNVPTVITQCLLIALYMGFKDIYLLGFDLDQICRMNDRSRVRFYGHSPITQNKSEEQLEIDLDKGGQVYFELWLLWKQLGLLRKYAESHNQNIINLTNGGLLDAFTRLKYEDVIKHIKEDSRVEV